MFARQSYVSTASFLCYDKILSLLAARLTRRTEDAANNGDSITESDHWRIRPLVAAPPPFH